MNVVYEDFDIRVAEEDIPALGHMLHCEAYRWAASVYRKLLWILMYCAYKHDVVYGIVVSDKQKKFMEILGFTPNDNKVISVDGIVYETYKFEVEKWKQ